jgi:hypothetical protein
LTLAPRLPTCATSPSSAASNGSRFSCLGSKSSGSEVDEEGIPAQVALQALEEDVEEGWSTVTRRKKPEAEVAADFWREIGFPTLASRFWEKSRSSRPPSGMSLRCKSAGVEDTRPPEISTPTGNLSRGACSSPSGVRLAWVPRMGAWRGPLPRRRCTPLPVLGQFLDMAAGSSSCSQVASPAVSSGSKSGGEPLPQSVPVMAILDSAVEAGSGGVTPAGVTSDD